MRSVADNHHSRIIIRDHRMRKREGKKEKRRAEERVEDFEASDLRGLGLVFINLITAAPVPLGEKKKKNTPHTVNADSPRLNQQYPPKAVPRTFLERGKKGREKREERLISKNNRFIDQFLTSVYSLSNLSESQLSLDKLKFFRGKKGKRKGGEKKIEERVRRVVT